MNISRWTNVRMYTSIFVFLLNRYLLLQRLENVVISRKWNAEGSFWPLTVWKYCCVMNVTEHWHRLSRQAVKSPTWRSSKNDWTWAWVPALSGCPIWSRGWTRWIQRPCTTSAILEFCVRMAVNVLPLLNWQSRTVGSSSVTIAEQEHWSEEPATSTVKPLWKTAWSRKHHLKEKSLSPPYSLAWYCPLGIQLLAMQFCLILQRSISCCHLPRPLQAEGYHLNGCPFDFSVPFLF